MDPGKRLCYNFLMKLKKYLVWFFLHYLRILAKLQLGKINLLRQLKGQKKVVIVGVTGSMGKTSTMLAIAAVLKDNFNLKYSLKANSETGIPLEILGLEMKNYSLFDWLRVAVLGLVKLATNRKDYDVYLVEMGVDEPTEPKNMSYLLKIIRPDIGVFTGVTSVHSMQFEKAVADNLLPAKKLKAVVKAIADEKGKMISALPKTGFAILNCDDLLVREKRRLTKAKVIGVGERGNPAIKITETKVDLRGTKMSFGINLAVNYSPRSRRIVDAGKKVFSLKLKDFVLPHVYADNIGLAIGVGMALGIDPKKVVEGVERNFQLPCGRSSLIRGIKDSLIIDSSYNASPKAMLVMLDLLDQLGKNNNRKKIAVLGDMRELGSQSKIEHQRVAKRVAVVADQIVLVGAQMLEHFLPMAIKEGFNQDDIVHFSTAFQAADFLKKQLSGKELVLVKGSQNTIFLEIVVEALMRNKRKADQLLCRRGKFWQKKRQELKNSF